MKTQANVETSLAAMEAAIRKGLKTLDVAEAEIARLRVLVRSYQLLARNVAKLVPSGDSTWASGLVVCEHCRLEYYDHPVCADGLLHVGCDGRLWKL